MKRCPCCGEESGWNGHSAKEWSLALQSLTPQGSEFASDPAACVEYVRSQRSDLWSRYKALIEERKRRGGP